MKASLTPSLHSSLHQIFIKTAKKYENKVAIIDRSTDKKLTYSKLLIASLILSDKISQYKSDFIGIMVPNSAGCILSILGTLMCGKVPVMINYSTGAANNIEFAKRKCSFKTVITSKALIEKIDCKFIDGMVFLDDIVAKISVMDKIKAVVKSKLPINLLINVMHRGDENDNAVILFTSGSENEPKAVQLTHKNIISNILGIKNHLELSDKDTMLANLPFFHVFGLTGSMWVPLYIGMKIVTFANPLEYKSICNIVREEKVTFMLGTPSFLWGYLRKSEDGDFKSIRLAICGADKCPDMLREEFLKKHNVILYEGYGTTETSPVISSNVPNENKSGSVGKLLLNVQIKIENYDTGEECNVDEVGRILVKGDSVMKGYLYDLEGTSMRIRHGWYDTGDMGYMDKDGYLWHRGRLKRFVKVGGEMVSLIRVENVLEKLIPTGVECCVVEIANAIKGSKIVAVVTDKIDEKKILKEMSEHLPNVAIPKQIMIINELPKMGSGKIDFRTVTNFVQSYFLVSKTVTGTP